MKAANLILVCLLICGPAYGRELKQSARSAKLLRAATTASKTEGTDTDQEADDADDQEADDANDHEADDADDQEMDNDTDDTHSDDDVNGTTTDMDDQDNNDMEIHGDGDNEADDVDDDTSTIKTTILKSLKLSALQRSENPLAATAASLNSGLSAPQTIAQMLEADSGHAAVASAAILQAAGGGSAAAESGALLVRENATMVASGSPSGGQLLVTPVPEPASLLLLVTAALPWLRIRRRP